jgi:superfamily II DNA or RNA helicase
MSLVSFLLDPRLVRVASASAVRWAALVDVDRRASLQGEFLANAGAMSLRDLVGRNLRDGGSRRGHARRSPSPEQQALQELVARLQRNDAIDHGADGSASTSSGALPTEATSPPRTPDALLRWGLEHGLTSLLCGPAPRAFEDESCAAAVLRGDARATQLVTTQAAIALPRWSRARPGVDVSLREAAAALQQTQRVVVPSTHWIPRAQGVETNGVVTIEVPVDDEVFVFAVAAGAIALDADDVAERRVSPGPLSPAHLPPFLALMESVAVEAVLDLLAWPTDEERALLERALRPSWLAVVDALRARAPTEAKTRRDARVVFELAPGFGVRARLQRRRTDGGFTVGERVGLSALTNRVDVADDDRALARLLAGPGDGVEFAPWSEGAVRVLVGHERVVMNGMPVRVDVATASLRSRPRDDGGVFVDVCVRGEAVPREVLGAWTVGPALLANEDERDLRVFVVDIPPTLRPIVAAVARLPDDGIPPEGASAWLQAVSAASAYARFELDVDPAPPGERVDPTVRPTVRLFPHADGLDVEIVVRPLVGAAAFPPGQGPRRIVVAHDGVRRFCDRDVDAEQARAEALVASLRFFLSPAGVGGVKGGRAFTVAPLGRAAALVAALQRRTDVDVEWPAGRAWRVVQATSRALRVRAGGSPTSLHLRGQVDVDGATLSLTRLLEASRDGHDWVACDDDTVVLLSDALRERAAALAAATSTARQDADAAVDGGVAAAMALDALVDDGAVVIDVESASGASWADWRARVAAARVVIDVPPPALLATLRPYQREGVRFLRRLAALGTGGVLADDMGLGKTLQTIALLVDRAGVGPQLVIAPTSLLSNWRAELARFAPSLRVHVHAGVDRVLDVETLRANDIVVTSYGVAVREAYALAARTFATLVLDEAQALKNADSQRARAIRTLVAGVRIALSGTPLENHTGELWSIFSTVAPGLLPSWPTFRARFQVPIERDHDNNARHHLLSLVAPFFLRRTKAAVAPELPPRTDVVVEVELSPVERERYDALRRVLAERVALDTATSATNRVIVLSALQRLRQFACDPALDDTGRDLAASTSSKLTALIRLLQAAARSGQRTLVFSQFTRLLDRIEPLLARERLSFVRLDGSTSTEARTQAVTTFQKGGVDVFLLSLKAGGVGLNLTAADHVVLLDPWWNPAVENQATDRAHRIGQTRPVTVHRLVARGTIEEAVAAMQGTKRALFASLFEGDANAAGGAGGVDDDALVALLMATAVDAAPKRR